MKNYNLRLLIILYIAGIQLVFGDSPLTSTFWADQYAEVPIIAEAIAKAKSGNQILSAKEIEFLVNDKNSLAHKLSLINANGWNIEGLNNAPNLLKSFLSKYKVNQEEAFLQKASSHDLIIYAYCLAMDNYFDVNKASEIAFKAFDKNSKVEKENSYALFLVFVIIKTQVLLDDMSRWCEIFENIKAVKTLNLEGKLKKDFKEEAAVPIYEYLDLYKNSCEDKK